MSKIQQKNPSENAKSLNFLSSLITEKQTKFQSLIKWTRFCSRRNSNQWYSNIAHQFSHWNRTENPAVCLCTVPALDLICLYSCTSALWICYSWFHYGSGHCLSCPVSSAACQHQKCFRQQFAEVRMLDRITQSPFQDDAPANAVSRPFAVSYVADVSVLFPAHI